MCFDFLYKFVDNISHLTRNERNMIKNHILASTLFVSDFNEIEFSRQIFRKVVKHHKLLIFKAANLKLPKSGLSVRFLIYIQRYLVRN